MIEDTLSHAWNIVAPELANHLWQSTLVAVVAGLLTLAFREHRARTRYWIWLAASLKFLLPFSLLVTLGRFAAWSHSESAKPVLYSAVEEITQPFSPPIPAVVPHTPLQSASSIWPHLAPVLLVLWFVGFICVLSLWIARWRRILRAMNSAERVCDGREVFALRRLELLGGIRTPISLLLSNLSLEPGIFGIARPVLLWPQGISTHLADAHLEAILAHEVWHVRRRDNLWAVLHMLVEAVFWFYPLVWWLGARLIEERERACDEEVLELGGDRQVYAESILKVCEFCLGSPLPCVSGITGADLKKRMVHIMNDRILHNLGLGRKLLLTTVATLAIAIPVAVGLLTATPSRAQSQPAGPSFSGPVFSSVSIKPHEVADPGRTQMMFSLMDGGSYAANGVTLQRLIQIAYHVPDAQVSGDRDLLNKMKFDIEAKLDPSFASAMHQQNAGGKPFDDLNQAMLKSLLADRFKLAAHWETRLMPAYDLLPAESGPKLQPAGEQARSVMKFDHGELNSSGTPLELLTTQLSARLGLPVVDKTGLKGNYAFSLHWTPDKSEYEHLEQSGEWVAPEPVSSSSGPSLSTALEEQLGLKLQPQTEPVQVLVIDHAEQPSQD